MYDVIIIGSGPAGLSAAIYSIRAGQKMCVLEKQPISGGQVINTYEVDNYPGLPMKSGMELSEAFRAHADALGAVFLQEELQAVEPVQDGYVVVTNQNRYETKTVLLATGALHKKLGVPGEEELAGMGVSYCATCDGAFFRNRTVCVVGGGDVALEDAIFLARACKKVYLIHRREELRGAYILQKQLKELENVEILWNTVVTAIQGEEEGCVSAVSLYNKEKEQEYTLETDGVFVAVGITPSSEVFANLVETDENGYVIAGEDGATSRPGIFVAGDVRTKQLRQIVTAVSDGANAITSIQNYLLRQN